MKRRAFIAGIGAAVAWPWAAAAQQGDRARRVGILLASAASDLDVQADVAAFVQRLQQSGWTDGRNVRIDTRWSGGNAADTTRYAAELVALAPDVILATGSVTVGPLLQATRSVPIVFVRPGSGWRRLCR